MLVNIPRALEKNVYFAVVRNSVLQVKAVHNSVQIHVFVDFFLNLVSHQLLREVLMSPTIIVEFFKLSL